MKSIQSLIRRTSALGVFAAMTVIAPLAAHAQGGDCANCGTVQSVKAVQHNGGANGIAGTQVTPGMAIGGVVGGLLGNQVGHGNGRAAATVVGAAGGAYAGHQIEKNQNRYTSYVMNIRMSNGTVRTIEQRTALARGSRVVVEGHSARMLNANRS
ncbi:MAG: glycine zipper 2TM domain-containing protein [Ramlibacter sp.]|nr:glycine zipper 2TM domain-containing protein [Ramlibacter sp.]